MHSNVLVLTLEARAVCWRSAFKKGPGWNSCDRSKGPARLEAQSGHCHTHKGSMEEVIGKAGILLGLA